MSMKNRDEQIKMQGARRAATGMYFLYMRIESTVQTIPHLACQIADCVPLVQRSRLVAQ
jgi:hypothetical protein